MTSLGDAHLWVGLKNPPRVPNVSVDVRIELLDNGVPVASGLQRCVEGLSGGANEVVIPWSTSTPLVVDAGDVLALRVSTRIGTKPNDRKCRGRTRSDGVRLFYDATDRASRFAGAITPASTANAFYLHCDGAGCSGGSSLSNVAPVAVSAATRDSAGLRFGHGNPWVEIGTWSLPPQPDCTNDMIPVVRDNPPAPAPEPISLTTLPLPPTAPSIDVGACDSTANPNGTGCLDPGPGSIQAGSFLPDGHHALVRTIFAGAPADPDPASIYSGDHISIVRTDGTTFSNGDAWKCITCGVPESNRMGAMTGANADITYPQAFPDGMRILAAVNVIDCSPHLLTDDACTPEATHIYPIRWSNKADPNASPGNMREVRLHPDGVHLGFNHIVFAPKLDEFGYYGRLSFNPAPVVGPPLVPRYDVVNVSVMFETAPDKQPWALDPMHPGEVLFNPSARSVGEFRGFTRDGSEAFYLGSPRESDNIDIASVDLTTGDVRYLTRNPEYCDPIQTSPDNDWSVAMDTRGSGRTLYLGAMEGIPPLNDLTTVAFVSSVRNNGFRRFFQPYLIDRYGDRGAYQGQQLNAGDGSPGSPSDPNWNGMADPWWSPDGTQVVYWQSLVTSPSCGGSNPLPCPVSTEPGGRRTRLMLATLTSRTPQVFPPVPEAPDTIPWAPAYVPGSDPLRPVLPAGTYVLRGKVYGTATFTIALTDNELDVAGVSATYDHYTDDGIHVIDGTESTTKSGSFSPVTVNWHSNLTLSGCQSGTKVTSEPGGYTGSIDLFQNIVTQSGTLVTTIDGQPYFQPGNNQ